LQGESYARIAPEAVREQTDAVLNLWNLVLANTNDSTT
jgi:hypothetical protein